MCAMRDVEYCVRLIVTPVPVRLPVVAGSVQATQRRGRTGQNQPVQKHGKEFPRLRRGRRWSSGVGGLPAPWLVAVHNQRDGNTGEVSERWRGRKEITQGRRACSVKKTEKQNKGKLALYSKFL